jgi:hypothetical protein
MVVPPLMKFQANSGIAGLIVSTSNVQVASFPRKLPPKLTVQSGAKIENRWPADAGTSGSDFSTCLKFDPFSHPSLQ